MFIVNQNGDYMQNLSNVGFIQVRGNRIVTESGEIARYADDDRAKEVFTNMVDALTPAIVMKNVDLPEDMLMRIGRSNFLICKDDVTIEQIDPIYRMPRE